ncbi:HTH-type transcriptional regulator PgrR [Paraburkholderia sediminicola]|uniref:HTH-type transcriptional regulator PgrR n=1 Tax=Paraburkholderia sediminicola TaxID=458836 RepID=A0A6J5A872_9BURK|nr:HTH-type transcriptional regulator PgrR [Paraburkholderia sediminicola]
MRKNGLTDLEAILTVARYRSFRSSAAELEISTSALSQMIAASESRIGVQLFHRTTRSVSLTDAGREFVETIAPAVAVIRDATERAGAQKDSPSGRIRVSTSTGFARQTMPMFLSFMERYPDIELELKAEDRIVDIVSEGFDLGIRFPMDVPKDMISVPFGRPQRSAVVATPEYFLRYPIPKTPHELHHHECVRFRLTDGTINTWDFEFRSKKIRIEPKGRLIVNSGNLTRDAVLSGVGIAFINEWHVMEDIATQRLQRVLEKWVPVHDRPSLYFANRRHQSSSLRALIAFARSWTPDSNT